MESQVPRSITEFTERYHSSAVAKLMQEELNEHLAQTAQLEADTRKMQELVQHEKEKWAIKSDPQNMNLASQVKNALQREYRQRWGDQWYVATVSICSRSRY